MTLLIRLFFVSYIETIIVWLWIQVRSNQRSSFTKISTKHVKHFLYKNTIGAQGGHKWPQWVLGTRVNNLAGSVKREIFDMNNNCQPMRTSAMVEARDLKWLLHTYVCPVHLTRNVCSVKEKNRGTEPSIPRRTIAQVTTRTRSNQIESAMTWAKTRLKRSSALFAISLFSLYAIK